MSDRRGFTLTELLITMSAGSVLMILAVGLVHQSMQLTSAARQRADEHRAMTQLASQFRNDVRLADQVTLESESRIRISTTQRGEVTYDIEAATCIRTTPNGQTADGNVQAGHEDYKLQPGGRVRFELLEQPRRAVLVLSRGNTTLHRPQENGSIDVIYDSSAPDSLRVEAVIGAVAEMVDRQPQE